MLLYVHRDRRLINSLSWCWDWMTFKDEDGRGTHTVETGRRLGGAEKTEWAALTTSRNIYADAEVGCH